MFGRKRGPDVAPAQRSAPVSIDLVWSEAIRIAERQEARLADLDSKTTPLLGFGLAVAVFLRTTNVGLGLATDFRDGVTGVVAIGLFATIAAMLPRDWGRVPSLATFIEDANNQPTRLKEMYLRNFMVAHDKNESVLRVKFRWFKLAAFAYLTALVLAGGLTLGPHG
jgi:hypothetical protein